MRVSRVLKLLAVVAACSIFLSICLWSQCNHGNLASRQDQNFYRDDLAADRHIQGNFDSEQFHPHGVHANTLSSLSQDVKYHPIDCIINGDYKRPVRCRRESSDVYMPFDFIKNYFEVYGKLEVSDGYEHLSFNHANSIIHPPRSTYSPGGIFMSFEYYHVEERDRVKCISGMEGVPISTQWTTEGHHYPIQIAQYGLSHHSKHILQGSPEIVILEDAEEDRVADWIIQDKRSQVMLTDDKSGARVLEFTSPDSLKTPGLSITADEKNNHFVSVDIKFLSNGSITVSVETLSQQVFRIHYVLSSTLILIEGRDIFYGLGLRRSQWIHIARDISIDLQKGLALRYNKIKRAKLKHNFSKITTITVRGQGFLDNLTLASSVHLDNFYSAADWLVHHQNDRGGWPVMVRRKLVPGRLELPPGWYSAMAQGQAMSLLVRAYLLSGNKKYVDAAVDAMKLFEISSDQGGVLAKFANTYEWYEEYPTTPSSFVLNGFIYSLFGLYDLKEVAAGDAAAMAERLYNIGMKSLKFMLLLYDTGSGTLYDLRHVSLGVEPNRARWDYHTTHINQLLQLSVIDSDPLFKVTANRWMGYMKGKKSKHN